MLSKFNPQELDGLAPEERVKQTGLDLDWAALGAAGDDAFSRRHALLSKWAGVYKQLQPGFFMMRTRVPGGRLSSAQARLMAALAARYALGQICITTRQCLQFHWVKLADIAGIMAELARHGLTGKNACGDVTRNICCCPWSGVCPAEQADARSAAEALEHAILQRDDLRNLPRKFKINFSGCLTACGQPFTNDLGWVGIQRNGSPGFMLFCAGGLGARPFLATRVLDFVPPHLVVPVAQAAITLFRDWGNRRNRAYARSKYVMHAFGLARYQELLREYLAAAGLVPSDIAQIIFSDDGTLPSVPYSFDRASAVIPQKQPGKVLVQILVWRGELTAEQLESAAHLADQYGDGHVYFTHRQNMELHGVDAARADELLGRLRAHGFQTEGFMGVPDAVACVGTTLCNLAVSNTPNLYRLIRDRIAAHPDPRVRSCRILININGCPNSCGQHKIADIGLRGMRLPANGGSTEAFELSLGGSIYQGVPALNEPVCCIPAAETPRAVEWLIETFVSERADEHTPFRQWYLSRGRAWCAARLNALVADAAQPGALNALLASPVPHSPDNLP